jgi:hypothetical protein
MLVMLSEPLPVLVRVRFWDGLVMPTVWLPKASELGDSVAVGADTPVPLRLVVLDPAEVLSVTVSVALRVPVSVGVKVTLMLQLAPAARLLPHPLVCE